MAVKKDFLGAYLDIDRDFIRQTSRLNGLQSRILVDPILKLHHKSPSARTVTELLLGRSRA